MGGETKRINFYSLVNDYNFKNESAYFDIILKEKISIILNFFIWMYLLSFLLWIRGVKTINLGESSSSSSLSLSHADVFLSPTSAGPSQGSQSTLESMAAVAAAAAATTVFDLRSTQFGYFRYAQQSNSSDNPSTSFELSVTSFCITHDFGVFLFNIFTFLMAILRLFTLFANLFTSICFHFKFRHEYYNAFRVSFRGKLIHLVNIVTLKSLNRLKDFKFRTFFCI